MKPKDIKKRKQMFVVLKHNILDDIQYQRARVKTIRKKLDE